jgi:hypothetical protein
MAPAEPEPGALRPRIIYLAGLGRSGTTLIERLLGELPAACAVGEVVHLWQRGVVKGERCGCGRPFHECPFWRSVGRAAFGGWDKADADQVGKLRGRVDRTRFLPLLASPAPPAGFRRALDDYLSFYLRLYTAVAAASGRRFIIDASKHASLAFCLHRCEGLELRVVHIVRDSRAVAYSWTKLVSRPDASAGGYLVTHPPATAAARWNVQNASMHMLARTGTPTLRVRYEDLVRDPEGAIRQIVTFAGMPGGTTALEFLGADHTGRWADLSATHTASGHPTRFLTGRVRIRPDETWRAAMPAAQRRTVTALTLPLLARYGYLRRQQAAGQGASGNRAR